MGRPILSHRQQLVGMDEHIDVRRSVQSGADTWMVGEGVFVDSEEGPAGLSLGNEALRHDIFLLERSFSVLDPEGADAAVSIEGYRFSSVEIIGPVKVWVLHHLGNRSDINLSWRKELTRQTL